MIEVQVPKDVSEYEATLIGPLTSRHTVCLAVAAVIEYVYYNIVSSMELGLDMNSLVCIGVVLAVPILYIAIGKPYGMRPEVYIYNFLLPALIASKDRPYETKLSYDIMLDTIELREEAGQNKNKNKAKNDKNKKPKPARKPRGKQDIMYK